MPRVQPRLYATPRIDRHNSHDNPNVMSLQINPLRTQMRTQIHRTANHALMITATIRVIASRLFFAYKIAYESCEHQVLNFHLKSCSSKFAAIYNFGSLLESWKELNVPDNVTLFLRSIWQMHRLSR